MKKFIVFYIFLNFFLAVGSAQGTWTQKTNFGGAGRYYAVGFSIGSKGYIGTGGNASTVYMQDFWEWDQAINVWTQKADFGGTARFGAVGYSIGTKGYIATGEQQSGFPTETKDVWEWNQATNTWTQKANLTGVVRAYAVGFSIGNKGYIGTGGDGMITGYNDFWEWQSSNVWSQKASFGGSVVRFWAVGFSIGTKGYIGTGDDVNTGSVLDDFGEWNQATNTWTQKANFGGGIKESAVGFSIGNKGYIGTGTEASLQNDFWEYDPFTNNWTQKANFTGGSRMGAVGFSIGGKGYIGTGYDGTNYLNDFWEYDTTSVTGISDFATINNISVYPNPSNGVFTIQSTNFNSNALNIYNIQGEKIYQDLISNSRSEIDISPQPKGIYFVKVQSVDKVYTEKVIIQ